MTSTLAGKLLVAAPSLRDPSFQRTVVLVVEHRPDGALGVVLNRPSDTSVAEILPAWEQVATEPAVVFLGGPVALNGVICLGRSRAGTGAGAGWSPLFAGLGTVDLETGPAASPAVTSIRTFAGHAGWGPAQLDAEVDAGAWFVVDATDDDALTAAPGGLWSGVLRRQGGALARVANFPDNPSAN